MEPFPGPRRVPGLRRDELAVLAGLSSDYYSRIEQGRQKHVSVEVLDGLARALRLTTVEKAHLRDVADPVANLPKAASVLEQRADPGMLRLMSALDHLPVLLLGQRGEILARNGMLCALLGRPLEPGTSFVRYLFLDSMARQRIINWSEFARASVAGLRFEAGRRPYDRSLFDLIDELRTADGDVARWWEDSAVRDYASVAKNIRHPAVGDLKFDIEIVTGPHEPDQRLVVYTVQPDSRTAELVAILASWGADALSGGLWCVLDANGVPVTATP
jgi:transcriptional regulator with XRE-family HTH domain